MYFGRIRELNRLRSPAYADALIVHARSPDRDRPRPDRHPALPRSRVTDDQSLPVLTNFLGERADVLVDLGLKRRSDHPTRTLPREIIKRDRALILPDGEPANILHGVPSFPASRRSVFVEPGRYAAFLITPIHNIGYSSHNYAHEQSEHDKVDEQSTDRQRRGVLELHLVERDYTSHHDGRRQQHGRLFSVDPERATQNLAETERSVHLESVVAGSAGLIGFGQPIP